MRTFGLMGVVALIGFSTSLTRGQGPGPKDGGADKPVPEVYAIGVYEGAYPPGVRHRAGFHPNGTVKVKVGEVKKPVVLVLTSYEPVVWKVEAPKGAVVKVIASGYYKQTVEGLDGTLPVTLLSHEAGNKNYFYAQLNKAAPKVTDSELAAMKRKYGRLVDRVKELTQQDLKVFQGEYAGSIFEIK